MPATATETFPLVFDALRSILREHSGALVVAKDREDSYHLVTKFSDKHKRPIYFGAVEIKKSYVSFHLFTVYMWPELLDDLSPGLRRRMQGKACFNFKKADAALFGELAGLTRRGFGRARAEGLA